MLPPVVKYYWALFKIRLRLRKNLLLLWVAGKLVRLACWLSPHLRDEMYPPRRRDYAPSIYQDEE